MAELVCPAPEDTLALGDAIGRAARPGLVVLLWGTLGAGKTLLTKGIARGLDVSGWRYVTSPTFAIHNQYRGRLLLHHLDFYRLRDSAELEGVGADEVLYGRDVSVIEWPDSFLDDLPPDRFSVRIAWNVSGDRVLCLGAEGDTAVAVLDVVVAELGGLLTREAEHDV